MIKLSKALAAWGTKKFQQVVKLEIQQLDAKSLPLQSGLSQTSYASESAVEAIILSATETGNRIQVKASIFFSGIIAGSCCADDPTPVDEQTEHCQMQFDIDKQTAETNVIIVDD